MTFIDIFANIAYILLDIATIFGLVGSAILAIGDVVAASLGRRFRPPEQVFTWISGGLVMGVGGFISILLSDQVEMEKTPFFGFSMTTIAVMLSISILLLIGGKILQRRVRRARLGR